MPKPWIDYLRRCSVMLQAGKHVADVAYFIGEDAPKMTGLRKPRTAAGYDFDYINADVIENRLTVKDGRFVLPDGMSYRLLVLPRIGDDAAGGAEEDSANWSPPAARCSARRRSARRACENFPACDAEVKKLAGELWGRGRVMTGIDLPRGVPALADAAGCGLPGRHSLEAPPGRRHRHLFPVEPEGAGAHGDDFVPRERSRARVVVAG